MMTFHGIFVWKDDQKMACAFPYEVCVPGLPNLDGTKTQDRYGTIYIKSREMLDVERKELARSFLNSGSDKDNFASIFVPTILFAEKSSPFCENMDVLNPYMIFGQEKVYLYYEWVMRGMATFENETEVKAIFLPFSTESEGYFDEYIDDDIEAGFKELSNWDKFFIGDKEKYDGTQF